MFSHLSLEIRLLIWEAILHQPRVVYVRMRECGPDPYGFDEFDTPLEHKPICKTPVPVLLHLCSGTRAFALRHYELTFGCKPPALQPGHFEHDSSQPFINFEYYSSPGFTPRVSEKVWVESNEAAVALAIAVKGPRIYFNFKDDIVVFGETWWANEIAQNRYRDKFGFQVIFDPEPLQKIENLGIRLDENNCCVYPEIMFNWFDRMADSGGFLNLKNLYLCLGDVDLDASRDLELLNPLGKLKEEEGHERMVQRFVDEWRNLCRQEPLVVVGEVKEALRLICKEGLDSVKRSHVRSLLLKNGAGLDDLLKIGWLRNHGSVGFKVMNRMIY